MCRGGEEGKESRGYRSGEEEMGGCVRGGKKGDGKTVCVCRGVK